MKSNICNFILIYDLKQVREATHFAWEGKGGGVGWVCVSDFFRRFQSSPKSCILNVSRHNIHFHFFLFFTGGHLLHACVRLVPNVIQDIFSFITVFCSSFSNSSLLPCSTYCFLANATYSGHRNLFSAEMTFELECSSKWLNFNLNCQQQ